MEPGNDDAMAKLLKKDVWQVHLFSFEGLAASDCADYGATVLKAKDSACQEDGVPYCEYKALPETTANCFATSSRTCSLRTLGAISLDRLSS